MVVCLKCEKGILVSDDPVTCIGKCGGNFHRVCTPLSRSAAKLIADNENLFFKCDQCLSGQCCDERDVQCSDVLLMKEEIKKLADSILDIRKNITAQISIAVESEIEQLSKCLSNCLLNRIDNLEGSVASKFDKIENNFGKIFERVGNFTAINRNGEKSVESDAGSSPKRKKQILSNKNDEPMQITDDEVFNGTNKLSFATVLKQKAVTKPKVRIASNRKARPVIVIKPVESSQNNDDTRKDLKEKLDPKIHKIRNFRNGKDGSIVVECATENDLNLVKNGIESNLCAGGRYNAVVPTVAKPKVKIVGMSERFSPDALIESLKSQNEGIVINDARVVSVFENPRFKYNKYNVVIEVDVGTFNNLMDAKKVNIGWDRCSVVDALYVMRCFNCGEFGHKSTNCQNKETCSKCSGLHRTSECRSDLVKCVNCVKTNKERKMNLNVLHPAFSTDCPVFQKLIGQRKSNMNYVQ